MHRAKLLCMAGVLLFCGCFGPYAQVKQSEWYRARARQLTESSPAAIWVGEITGIACDISIDPATFSLRLADPSVLESAGDVEPGGVSIHATEEVYFKFVIKKDETWVILARADAQGRWWLEEARRLDPETGQLFTTDFIGYPLEPR